MPGFNDAMIRRLEQELEERNAAATGIIANAQDSNPPRDLNDAEKQALSSLRDRMANIQSQLEELESTKAAAISVHNRMKQLDVALTHSRKAGGESVEYRSAGEWALDSWKASLGDRAAAERIDVFYRQAQHDKTGDLDGVIPDPIVGPVISFIDAARPLVNAIGPRALPSASWHRPVVTQFPNVDIQGSSGGPADEKTELVSRKMTLTRINAEAVTYGGYVNVSRQAIDFSNGAAMDAIIGGLAAEYAIATEQAAATELDASLTAAVGYGASPDADSIRAALWSAAGTVYGTTKGQGRLYLALAPDVLPVFGPLFAPIVGVAATGEGLSAANFSQGALGTISGIPVLMSAGLGSGKAFLFSTAAIEVYEQRVGTLQVAEPSVLGVQVAYAGYFTALTIDDGGIVELTATT